MSKPAVKKSSNIVVGGTPAGQSPTAASVPAELTPKTSEEYTYLLEKLQDMPTLPVIAMKVSDLINDPNSTSADIANILKQDQVLTAKILRLVNSSYYAVPGGVTHVQKALAFLGFNTVSQLVLSLSVFSMFTKFGNDDVSVKDFWMHALATAVCGELISKKYKIGKPEEIFTCGLLHDIGKLVLHEIDLPRLKMILTSANKQNKSFLEIERENEFLSHAYIGELMAARWGLPQVVRQAIRYHHHDADKMDSLLPSAKKVVQIVRLANQIVVKNKIGKSGDYSAGTIIPQMVESLGIKMEQIADIERELAGAMDKAGAFLNAST